MCFTECMSENYKMVFPSPTTIQEKLNLPAANRFDFDNYALKKDNIDPLDDVRTYLQQCETHGQWSGRVGTCKSELFDCFRCLKAFYGVYLCAMLGSSRIPMTVLSKSC